MKAIADAIKLKRKGKTLYAVRTVSAVTGSKAYNIFQPSKHNQDDWQYIYTEGQKFVDEYREGGWFNKLL